MGFNSVFKTLQEVFPTVDVRMLKAAAIEHSKDADSAVEFILLEALPAISGQIDPSKTLATNKVLEKYLNTSSDQHMKPLSSSSKAVCGKDQVRTRNKGVVKEAVDKKKALSTNSNSFGVGSLSPEEQRFYHVNQEAVTKRKLMASDPVSSRFGIMSQEELRFLSMNRESVSSSSTSFAADGESHQNTSASNACPSQDYEPSSPGFSTLASPTVTNPCKIEKAEESISLEDINDTAVAVKSNQGIILSDNNVVQHEKLDLNYPTAQCDLDSFVHRDAPEAQFGLDDTIQVELVNVSSTNVVKLSSLQEKLSLSVEASSTNGNGSSDYHYENPVLIDSVENVSALVLLDTDSANVAEDESSSRAIVAVSVEDPPCSTTIETCSGQACLIDLLEDSVTDAKNNKKVLFSSMEVVINMMKEVELQEDAAEQAKVEAASGSSDILAKVEDLKQMLRHANEANDMHAGEVFGEKAILATEARELQTRLLSLLDERDKSLEILQEMRQKLELRLEAAELLRQAAEQEKLDKALSAKEALAEQELIMDKVVQESKRLQQIAEDNSKLQEFLMDRGHTVDILQGEISVICKDVKLVKEKFDGCISLSKSLSSAPTSWNLASSGSSSSSRSIASDNALEHETSESLKSALTSPVSSVDVQAQNGTHHKVLSDDDWYLFDDVADVRN